MEKILKSLYLVCGSNSDNVSYYEIDGIKVPEIVPIGQKVDYERKFFTDYVDYEKCLFDFQSKYKNVYHETITFHIDPTCVRENINE